MGNTSLSETKVILVGGTASSSTPFPGAAHLAPQYIAAAHPTRGSHWDLYFGDWLFVYGAFLLLSSGNTFEGYLTTQIILKRPMIFNPFYFGLG
jgi:hypothetical protein